MMSSGPWTLESFLFGQQSTIKASAWEILRALPPIPLAQWHELEMNGRSGGEVLGYEVIEDTSRMLRLALHFEFDRHDHLLQIDIPRDGRATAFFDGTQGTQLRITPRLSCGTRTCTFTLRITLIAAGVPVTLRVKARLEMTAASEGRRLV
jgi:hypothetical protein